MHTQLVVLGGGPGGYAAAFFAADHGMDVTIVEQQSRLGGTCLLKGCIPSKALLHVARVISEVRELHESWGVRYAASEYAAPKIDVEQLRARKEKVIENLSGGLRQLAKRRKVRVICARGNFENSTTLLLDGDDPSIPEDRQLTFDHAILATGSVAAMPQAMAIRSPRVIDSTGALALVDIPETLLVIGGGYIGLELGTVYAQLGSKVSVVELTEGLLPGADRDLVRPLQRRLRPLLEDRLYLNTKVTSLCDCGDSVEVVFEEVGKEGDTGEKSTRHYDRVLIAVGRNPHSEGFGLENTDVKITPRGFVECDAQQRTADPHILAIGDVVGEPMLAHKATHEGKAAIRTLLGETPEPAPTAIPAVIFTDPEIAWAGLTQEQAKREGRQVKPALYPWAANGRAQALGLTDGLTKWLIDPETDRVLGCGIVGTGAGELIAEAVLAIETQCKASDLAKSIHPHPTISETLMGAAESYLGTATEIYKPRRR